LSTTRTNGNNAAKRFTWAAPGTASSEQESCEPVAKGVTTASERLAPDILHSDVGGRLRDAAFVLHKAMSLAGHSRGFALTPQLLLNV
jgi:hypothetical protein